MRRFHHLVKRCVLYSSKPDITTKDSRLFLTPVAQNDSGQRMFNSSSDSLSDSREQEEFGSLVEKKGVSVFKLPIENRLPTEEDEEERPKPKLFSNYTPYWYFLQCKKLAKQNKTMECVKFFEERMLKEDGVFPEEMNYSVVIGALGRAGYANKAFKLYNQMRKRAIQPSVATYTGLFNAVAESSNSENLKKAVSLYSRIHESNIRISRITYNAIIKAFGRHGTTEQMMGIFRESIVAGFEPDCETFNMILLSLQRDKEAGFRHAIEIWRMMQMLGIDPNGKSIMYLLKVLKHCGIGNPDLAYRKLIQDLPDPAEYKDFFKKNLRNVYWLKGQKSIKRESSEFDQIDPPPEILTIDGGVIHHRLSESDTGTDLETDLESGKAEDTEKYVPLSYKSDSRITIDAGSSKPNTSTKTVTNLLQMPFERDLQTDSSVRFPVSITQCGTPWLRLRLIGGHEYVFEMMEKHDIKPTVMLLSTLVQVLEPSRIAENEVISFAEKNKVKFDTDFFNSILRKRAAKFDVEGSQIILRKMVSSGLTPNYRTWCTSALTCWKSYHGVLLMNEAKNSSVDFDHVFFNSLISAAMRNNKATKIKGYEGVTSYDYSYLCRIIYEMQQCNVRATPHTIELLEKASEWPEGYDRWSLADREFEQKVFNFRKIYKEWLNKVVIMTEENPVCM